MTNEAGSTAQRIRIGLTGLAFAFLLVLLGSAISRSRDDGSTNTIAASANDAEPSEPMAELGIAPGGKEAANNSAGNGSQ